ncbi:rab11 family-interacting protein 1 [Brachionichthys hirsutus]|uniref:rab11 family-interacting protein 1 n=1 Tax=Brachionichthys hirsutus TaxID=412623 RepID=UPI003604E502
MSLADQSQQWFPTSVQVTVHQARSLRAKGKNGTSDSYAIIQVAKDKFSTSVAERSVEPVWKEEASFDLPLFHPGNAERCTLSVTIMHRAHVGLDKFMGQAVVNLLGLHDNQGRKKTDWFTLVDKSGKEDKPRGEVLLDIQFMRNNMSASMFDLSMKDKPRSRISKIKDKVRGKKKDGFSDSASAIVPSVSQVLTDSDPEADAQSLNQTPGAKKKSKLKALFTPKSNLERNISKSMSTLGTLPEKNSSRSGSRSSGLNVESPQVKNKFKFLGHKRTGSSDSKVSLGAFSLLGRSNKSNNDQNSLCVNGSHVYAEEAESKSGSSLSLNSSGQGSVEDVPKLTVNADPSFPTIRVESDSSTVEQQRHQEEEERRQANERRMAEAKRLEDEEKYRDHARRLQEEEERRYQEEQVMRRRVLEDEARRKKQREEEEEERKEQEDRRRKLEAAELQRFEEERRKAEEQKRQEETSMSERLTSLFGMIRKKDERKEEEEVHKQAKEVAPQAEPRAPSQLVSHRASNPFEDIPFNADAQVGSVDPQKSGLNPQSPSAMLVLNRAAKVSAVKPRLAKSLESEPPECQTPSQPCPSPATSEPPLSRVPSESPDTFSTLHSSLAPPDLSGSPRGSTENLSSVGSSPTMADKKKRAPMPSSLVPGTQNGGSHTAVRNINNPVYVEENGLEQGKKMSLPLPDYESLFPQKRHGVQGQTRWDHIIAEVSQKHRDSPPEFLSQEMSVDGPVPPRPGLRSSLPQESPAPRNTQTFNQEPKPLPPKKKIALTPRPDSTQRHSPNIDHQSAMRSNPPVVPGPAKTDALNKESLSVRSRDGAAKVSPPTLSPRLAGIGHRDTAKPDDKRSVQLTVNQEAPIPRQRTVGAEPEKQVHSSTPNAVSEKHMSGSIQPSSSSGMSSTDKTGRQMQEHFAEFDPFPTAGLISKDPWAHVKQNQEVDQGMTAEDLDSIFNQERPTDPFSSFNSNDSNRAAESRGKGEDPAFQRTNSQRSSQGLPPTTPAPDKQGFSPRGVANEPNAPSPQADLKTQSLTYGQEDLFGAGPFPAFSPVTSFEPLEVVMEEPEPQAGDLSGRMRAWGSPSEAPQATAQSSNGGGLSFTPRRPHPVKPMNSAESQQPVGYPAVKEIKVRDSAPGRIQAPQSVGSGPYTQLTQEELITMVVRQQTDLSRKSAKIVELEEYIDNLLVRVIDEKPAILQALNAPKPM